MHVFWNSQISAKIDGRVSLLVPSALMTWHNCYSYAILHQYHCGSGEMYCGEIYAKIASHSNTSVAPMGTGGRLNSCLVFDEDTFKSGHGQITSEVKTFCGVSQLFMPV